MVIRTTIAFETTTSAFELAPAFRRVDHERDVTFENDVSNYVSAGVLSERDDEKVLHPVAYFSKKHTPADCNYDIYDKQLIAIIKALEECRP